jgi:hypothetical protein
MSDAFAPAPPAPVRRHLSAAERTALGRAVSTARARGEGWSSIAGRLCVNERTARRAMDDYNANAQALGPVLEDPHAVLREVVAHHRAALADLERLSAEGNNASAKVAAARGRGEVSRALLTVLADAGVVPDSVGAWRLGRDLQSFVRAIREVCERNGISVAEVLAQLEAIPGFGRLTAPTLEHHHEEGALS